jgi:hypothetical protein
MPDYEVVLTITAFARVKARGGNEAVKKAEETLPDDYEIQDWIVNGAFEALTQSDA